MVPGGTFSWLPGQAARDGRPRVLASTGRTSPVRLYTSSWARTAALTTALAFVGGMTTAQIASAQQTPSVALEQARSGEDGTSGAGAESGGLSTGSSKRDKNGNGSDSSSTATAGSAGDTGGSESSDSPESTEAPLPANADVLAALGVLDDAQNYDLDILTGLDIPVELIPAPPVHEAPAAPADVNTGGQGDASSVSTDPGSGSAPAGGSTGTAAEDGTGSTAQRRTKEGPASPQQDRWHRRRQHRHKHRRWNRHVERHRAVISQEQK